MHGTLEILSIVMIHEMGIPIQQHMEERNDSSHSLTKRYKISFPNQTNKKETTFVFLNFVAHSAADKQVCPRTQFVPPTLNPKKQSSLNLSHLELLVDHAF